jgi:hypothetical protein
MKLAGDVTGDLGEFFYTIIAKSQNNCNKKIVQLWNCCRIFSSKTLAALLLAPCNACLPTVVTWPSVCSGVAQRLQHFTILA